MLRWICENFVSMETITYSKTAACQLKERQKWRLYQHLFLIPALASISVYFMSLIEQANSKQTVLIKLGLNKW